MIYISLNRTGSVSLTKQICSSLRDAILKGTLKPNEKLPSSRELAKYLKVSRNIVISSYEQLFAEGYIYTKNGSPST
jgi:GntR family transcriptional regulator / MocR family aminotransferase